VVVPWAELTATYCDLSSADMMNGPEHTMDGREFRWTTTLEELNSKMGCLVSSEGHNAGLGFVPLRRM
jgi:hypothetical protein